MSVLGSLLRVLGEGARALFGAALDEITKHAAEPAKPKREPLQQITDEELGRAPKRHN